jgi:hypothetical protein
MSSCDDFLSTGVSNYNYSTEIDYGVALFAVLTETISNKISSLHICDEVFSKMVEFVNSTTRSEHKVIVLQIRSDCIDLPHYKIEHFADKLMLECPSLQNTILIYSTSKVLTRFNNKGSHFVTHLINTFKAQCMFLSVTDMLDLVNSNISESERRIQYRQIGSNQTTIYLPLKKVCMNVYSFLNSLTFPLLQTHDGLCEWFLSALQQSQTEMTQSAVPPEAIKQIVSGLFDNQLRSLSSLAIRFGLRKDR